MNTIVLVNPKEYGLEESKASKMISGLDITKLERDVLKEAYLDVLELEIKQENIHIFKELRLKIVKNRTQGLNKWKEKEKAFYLAGGNFIQAIYNKEVLVNQEMESKLMDAEKHFENLEKRRIEKLNNERLEVLGEFVEDTSNMNVSDMDSDVWDAYLSTKKQNYLKQIEIELQDEKERQAKLQAEKDEQDRIKKENDKLRAEAKEVERLAKIESDKLIKQQEKEKAKIAADLKQRKAEDAKRLAEFEAKLKKERDASDLVKKQETEKRQKLEAELKAKKDSEIAAEKLRLSLELKAKKEAELLAKAPIKKQLNSWVNNFSIELPSSELLNNDKALLIKSKFEEFKKWASNEVDSI